MTNLDLSKNIALESLNLSTNTSLASLDISGCIALKDLNCGGTRLTTLDVSECPALERLQCGWIPTLASLDLSKNTALKILFCWKSGLTDLDVSKCTELESLDCNGNLLTNLDISKNTVLTSLDCSENQLTELNVSRNTLLTSLNCEYNQLVSLDVSKNIVLTSLTCSDNKLTNLNVGSNMVLISVSCQRNELTNLDMSGCSALKSLHCPYNKLASLNMSGYTLLDNVWCNNNQLTKLDLDDHTEEWSGTPSGYAKYQTSRLEIQKTSNGWTADLSKLVSVENTKKVELQEGQGWQYDAETGVASYTGESMPEELIYYYGGNNVPKDKMDVTVTLFESEEQQYVVMKQGAEQAYVNGIVAPTTQYATGYATMENISGTMQLPLRYIAEVNGFTVDYDADTEKTKVTNPADGTYLLITPGSNAVTKHTANGTLVDSSNAPLVFTIQNGVTMGPLRFTCEALGLAVSYQETSHSIYVVISPEAQTTENALAKIGEAYQKGL